MLSTPTANVRVPLELAVQLATINIFPVRDLQSFVIAIGVPNWNQIREVMLDVKLHELHMREALSNVLLDSCLIQADDYVAGCRTFGTDL